jgi:uncharacterized protein (DUF3084 family)
MLVSFGFLLAMILAGGLVALMADKLGRTLGKKRLSLLGMRPRHTATSITVVAGMVIPLFTVLFVAVVSKDAREWILKGNQAISENKDLIQQTKDLDDKIVKKNKDIDTLTSEGIGLKKRLSDGNDRLRLLNGKLVSLQGDLGRLTSEISNYQGQIKTFQNQLGSEKTQLATADKSLKATQEGLAQTTTKFNKLTNTYNTLQTLYTELDKQRNQAYQENMKITGDNADLTKLNAQLKKANDDAAANLALTKSTLEFTSLNLDKAKIDLASAQAEQRQQEELFRAWSVENVTNTRLKQLTFTVGDELARVTIPAGTDEGTSRALFANLMDQAVKVAMANGAKSNEQFSAAALFAVDDQKQQIPADVQENTIIQGLTNAQTDIVLIAACELNAYRGESVPISVRLYHSPVVYRRNDKIAETTINGSELEVQMLQDISNFLTNTLKPKALKDGMIPATGHAESFGEVPVSDLFDLVRQIKNMARPVRLAALADTDTRAGDPLHIHFRVR